MRKLVIAMVAALATALSFPSLALACKAGEKMTKHGKSYTCNCMLLNNGATVCGYSPD
jgi:hypothetical protein